MTVSVETSRGFDHVRFSRAYTEGRGRWLNVTLCDSSRDYPDCDVSENPDLFDFENAKIEAVQCAVCVARLAMMRANKLSLTRGGLAKLDYLLRGGDASMLELLK